MITLTRLSTYTKLTALAGTLGLLTLTLGLGPASASTASGPARAAWAAELDGYTGVYGGRNIIPNALSVEGAAAVKTYCVEMDVSFVTSADFVAAQRSATGISGLANAAWLAKFAASTGTTLSDPLLESAAVQIAIWSFTDDAVIDASLLPPGPAGLEVVARANELVAASSALAEAPVSFAVDITANDNGSVVAVNVTTSTNLGPASDQSVTLNFPGGSTGLSTNEAGVASFSFPSSSATGRSVSASWSTVLAAGSILDSDSSQAVVTTQDSAIVREASVSVPDRAAPVVTSVPSVTTKVPAVPTTKSIVSGAAPISRLPYTGNAAGIGVLIAALGAATAGGLLYRRSLKK